MPPTFAPLHLVFLEDDPTYRAGLRLWLEQFADITVGADGATTLDIELIAAGLRPSQMASQPLIVLSLPNSAQGFARCQQLRAEFPTVPILLLGNRTEPVIVAAARRAGASGFWLRNGNPDALGATIRRVAAGQPVWVGSKPTPLGTFTATPGPLLGLRHTLRVAGVQQMQRAIAELNQQLSDRHLTSLERLILEGRRREVRAARWLVMRILATPALSEEAMATPAAPSGQANAFPPLASEQNPIAALERVEPVPSLETRITPRSLRTLLINAVLQNLQTSVENLTDTPLEIDILRAERKQELFILILRKLEALLDDLQFSQVTSDQLNEKRSHLLQDLWQATTSDYFGKYYTLSTPQGDLALVPALLADAPTVQLEILNRIPYAEDLLAHLLFQTPLVIDGTPYGAGNPEALMRAEMILGHLLIQVANGVLQPLLNRFSDLEVIKQQFYDRRLMSTREVERFRNDLSWHYRLNYYFADPRDMFESQYRLLTFQPWGIQYRSIYAPRRRELEQLRGVPYLVTLALETRDAIAPRLRTVFSVVGSSLVYLLTEVIGRGIGLVGRGIAKGVGNVWQDHRYPRNSERQR